MNRSALGHYYLTAILCCTAYSFLHAEKVLVYDPVKGIIFVDKKDGEMQKKNIHSSAISPKSAKSSRTDIHIGRKKDPPELYFKSGLEYFQNGDYKNALKNFCYTDSVDPNPQSMLWKAKTYRQMGDFDKMLFIMQQIIENYPESDVADDALFELALHYQKTDDYHRAVLLYARLTEQYPFGLLFSTGEELREIAREQRKLMRAELVNLLSILGYTGGDVTNSLRSFQKTNDLEVSGNADQKTVQLIRTRHTEFLHNEEKQLQEQKNLEKFKVIFMIASGLSLLSLLLIILMQSRIHTKKQHICELRKILSDLDLSKL
ncbi:MAG TPA: tetratricopeptide repeat protein [Chitinispirillaceae bacterium]|nr:tetratricopeptide repeat protein [Chitinispirillaceae bacterium]